MKKIITAALALGVGLALAAPAAAQEPSDPGEVPAQASLIAKGAQVYANQCGRCHNMRSSTERTDAEWKVIVSHMRTRGNMTKSEAEWVKAFLQATNRDASPGGAVGAPTRADEVPPPPQEAPRPAPDVPPGEMVELLRGLH